MTRRITVGVYEADNTTAAGTLASDRDRKFLKDLSAEGSYSFEIKIGHADEALITDGRIVRFSIDGTARWPGLIEPRQIVYADGDSRQAGRVIKVSGRGLLSVFEWVPVYPERGLGFVSPETRYFNVGSSAYDVSSFPLATAFHKVNTTTTSDPYYGKPKDFPDGDAYWIGPSDGVTSLPARIGFYWLTPADAFLDVPVGEGGDYRFSVAADDAFELFVDGNKEGAESRAGLFSKALEVTLNLEEGRHRLALRVENFDRTAAASNATAAVVSVAKELDGGDTLGTPIARTDATWQIYEVFGAAEPGMSPGFILDLLLTEAQANGYLTGLTWDFDGDFDSSAVVWPSNVDVAFPVGTSLLDVIRHFVDEHLIDVEMAATGLVLHAYVSKGTDRTGSVTAAYGTNLSHLAFGVKPPGPNAALSRTAEGRWVERVRTAAAAAWGKRGVFLSLGSAPSVTAADRQADAYFDDNSKPVEAITDMQIEEVNAVPFANFDVGDLITATASDGSAAACRVQGISVSEDAAGNPIWTPDLVRSPGAFPGDAWARAIRIAGSAGSIAYDTTEATAEASEPIPSDGPGNGPWRTVWFRWVAPASDDFFFSTQGSRLADGSGLDTVIAVYTGASLVALVEVASNDDYAPFTGDDDFNSRVAFTAVSGTTYYVQVSGYDITNFGAIALEWGLV